MSLDFVMYDTDGNEVGRFNKCKDCEWLYNDICTCDANKPCENFTIMSDIDISE